MLSKNVERNLSKSSCWLMTKCKFYDMLCRILNANNVEEVTILVNFDNSGIYGISSAEDCMEICYYFKQMCWLYIINIYFI